MNKVKGIDYRSLSLFRQIIAILYIFLFFVIRVVYFDYYSIEYGPFSNTAMGSISNPPLLLSILHSDVAFIVFLCVGLVIGCFLLIGVFTSLASFTAAILYILSARRFVPYYYGTDEIVIVCLVIIGLVYLLNPKAQAKDNYISCSINPFVLLLLVQIAIIYFFNGINKTSIYWWNGEAVNMALFNVQFNKPLGVKFIGAIPLNMLLTYATLCLEIGLFLILFWPKRSNALRIVAGVSLLLFHWGIDLFANVTLYKFVSIAFFILLMPALFWERFKWLEYLVWDVNIRIKKEKLSNKLSRVVAISLIVIFVSKAFIASIDRQNERYKFIKSEQFVNVLDALTSRTYSPFRQFWFMFAPSPPINSGYIAFEYEKSDGTFENINIYGNQMPTKKFNYFHPFHMCSIIQFNRVNKGVFPDESQFILIQLFEFEINRNIEQYPSRKIDNYVLTLYKQSYNNYKLQGEYNFERIILASYD